MSRTILNTAYRLQADLMTTAVRLASSCETGTLVFDTDLNALFSYNAGSWKEVSASASGLTTVSSKTDLPTAESGIITLAANTTYFFTSDVDLEGDRLVGSSDTGILGTSSENASITSTGLGAGVPLFTTEWTTPIRDIAFTDVDTAIDITGTSNTVALDWIGVNFVNVPNIGTINTCDNFIYARGAFLNSKGLTFTGTVGTIGVTNSLLSGDGASGSLIEIQSSATITRRFRIIYSAIIATSSTVGLNVSTSATISNEDYILDTVNFAGGGTYLSGVTSSDNKALFSNCQGIDNSADVAQYFMNGNATATVISSVGVEVKVAGTTTNGAATQKFTHSDNRATYVGALTRFFKVTATLSVSSGNNNQVGAYIAKNGTIIPESEIYGTTNSGGRAENIVIQTLVELTENDYIEIFVENETATTNITVTDLNVIID